jgi:D-methionine transport system permease protein
MEQFFANYGELLAQGTIDTLVMTIASTFFAYVIGLPLGIWFAVTTPTGLAPNKAVNTVLGWIINIGRSIPFSILLVAIIPFTRLVVGTSLGVPGAIVPLTVAAAPFVARIVEQSLAEVDKDLIEAAHSFGASNVQIVVKVMLKESLPSLVRGVAITFVNLFGYSAMAGTVGAGGLGDIAIRYGYQRFRPEIMLATVIILIVLVQLVQFLGNTLAKKLDKR